MRTTIDPKLNLSTTPMKSLKKASSEASSSFDDALKAATPRAAKQRPEEAKPAEKKIEPKKKPEKSGATEETAPAEDTADTTETVEPVGETDESSDDGSAEDESTGKETEKPVTAKEKSDPSAQPEDYVEIAPLVVAQPPPANITETVDTQATEEPAVTDAIEKPTQKGVAQQLNSQARKDVSRDASASELPEGVEASVSPVQTQPSENQRRTDEQDVASDKHEAAQTSEKAIEDMKVKDAAPVADKSPVPVEVAASPALSHQVQTVTTKLPEPQAPQQPAHAQDLRFAEDNHPQIVTGIRGELLPSGGKMTLKLDPPELGALQVQVHIQDGAMTATFQTTNDDATRLLSHSLATLKNSLESQGISVEKLQVQQAPRDQQTSTGQDPREQQQQSQWDNPSARQEQQRREMLQRMWRKLAGAEDPLDLVA